MVSGPSIPSFTAHTLSVCDPGVFNFILAGVVDDVSGTPSRIYFTVASLPVRGAISNAALLFKL